MSIPALQMQLLSKLPAVQEESSCEEGVACNEACATTVEPGGVMTVDPSVLDVDPSVLTEEQGATSKVAGFSAPEQIQQSVDDSSLDLVSRFDPNFC